MHPNPITRKLRAQSAPRKMIKSAKPKRAVKTAPDESGPDLTDLAGAAANMIVPGSGGVAKIGASLIGNGLSWAKSKIAKIMGSGDYTIGEPVSQNVLTNSNQVPRFGSAKRGVLVTHREFIGDVYSPAVAGTYQIRGYGLTPLNQEVFPWLCGIAANYSLWKFEGAAVEFRSMCGPISGSTNTALGTVVLAHAPDPKDPLPTMKHILEQREGVVSVKTSENVLLGIECAKGSRPTDMLYLAGQAFNTTTPGSVEGTLVNNGAHDIDFTTWGRLLVAVDGVQGASVKLGELWITYSVYLDGARDSANRCEGSFLAKGVGSNGSTLAQDPFSVEMKVTSSMPWTRAAGSNVIVFPRMQRTFPGRYFRITWLRLAAATAGVVGDPGFTLGNGFIGVDSPYQAQDPSTASTSPVLSLVTYVRIKESGVCSIAPSASCVGPTGSTPVTQISVEELNAALFDIAVTDTN